ncbi:MAG: hypothetical protein JNM13_15840, partial [Hyphomicrobiaceae bacterium]|nr:hypothetical protein [Hyphomicrobiaceae bacterium]
MAQSTTFLSFRATDQNLWGPGAAIELGINTGDALIYDPDEVTYGFDIGGSFLGISGEFYFDFKFGLYAYAEIGEVGRFGGGIDILVNVEHSAVVTAGDQIVFDFSDYTITNAQIDSQGFSVGPKAGIDLVIGAQLGIRDIEYALFGVGGSVDNVSIISIDENIPLISVGPGDLELPFDLGYGLELTLRVPTGADTSGSTSGSAFVMAEGVSDTPFLQLDADLDEMFTSLLKKIPFPPLGAIAKTLEDTLFATFEFDINDYVPFIPKDVFKIEATVLDIGATIGTAVSEEVSLDFSTGDGVTPDVTVVLVSDNGTVGDFSDDITVSGRLGDANLGITAPGYDGFGPITVSATYELANPRFAHSLGIDLVGEFTVQALKAVSSGSIGDLLGLTIGPLLDLTFPEGENGEPDGFRVGLLDDLYTDAFDVAGGAFNTVSDSYEIFYTSTVPQGIVNYDAPGVVQQLIAYNETRQINIAASNAAFADVIAGRIAAVRDLPSGTFNNRLNVAEFATWQFDQTVGNANLEGGRSLTSRDVVNVDAFNVSGVFLSELTASYVNSFGQSQPFSGQISAASAHSLSGYNFLINMPLPSEIDGSDATFGGIAQDPVLIYEYSGRIFRSENSVNILGNSRDDLLVYWGNEARLLDGGSELAGSATGDVLVANFGRSHGLDRIEWDLRTSAVGQSGAAVDLQLTRDNAQVFNASARSGQLERTGYQNAANNATGIELANGVTNGLIRTAVGAFNVSGTHVLRLSIEDTANGASTFLVRVINSAGNVVVGSERSITTNETPAGGTGGYSEVAIYGVQLNFGDRIEIVTTRGGATGVDAEAARISNIRLHEQHNVSFRNIESFMLQTSQLDDIIFTSSFRDGIVFGDGNDTLFLTADRHEEVMDMGLSDSVVFSDNDIALVEMKTAQQVGSSVSVVDRVYFQAGVDEAIMRNLSSVGARWQAKTPDPATGLGVFTSALIGFDVTSDTDLFALLGGLRQLWEDPIRHVRREDLPQSNLPGNYIEISVQDGAPRMSTILVNVEAVSFQGSDTGNDFAAYFGGTTYDGGASLRDTFAADFSHYTLPAGVTTGISLSGFNDQGLPNLFTARFNLGPAIFRYDEDIRFANGTDVRTSEIKGFERLIVIGTAFGDVLQGGAFSDTLYGGDGADILVGGGSFNIGVLAGLQFGQANTLDGGAGADTYYSDGSERSNISSDSEDRLIFGGGFLEAIAPTYGLTLQGLRQTFKYMGGVLPNVTYAATDSSATLLTALDQFNAGLFGRDFTFEAVGGLGAFVSGAVRTNLTGLNATDDLFIADGGGSYIGGERAGDRDTFVADFTAQTYGISWNVEDQAAGARLSNGIFVAGIDRVILRLGSGADIVSGGDGDDVIHGGGGSDMLRGGGATGQDLLFGGSGADLFAWMAGDGTAVIDGGSDVGDTQNAVTDRLVVSAVDEAGNALTPGTGLGFNIYFGGTGPYVSPTPATAASTQNVLETIYFGLDDNEQLRIYNGTSYVTTTGVESVDVFGSGAEDDLIVYQNGTYYDGGDRAGDADIFIARLDAETDDLTIRARAGDDRASSDEIFADIGNGTTIGNFERLLVRAGSGDDRLFGGDLADLLDGGDGDDILVGGLGNDQLFGGTGRDLMFYSAGQDFLIGGADVDTLEMGAIPFGFLQVTGLDTTNNNAIAFNAAVDDCNSVATTRAELSPLFNGIALTTRWIISGQFNTAVAHEEIERVVISAEGDRDILISGTMGGILSGDGGNDVLIGLGGTDVLVGGDGLDRYAFGGNWGQDIIAGEYSGTGEIHFFGWTRAQITFALDAPGGDDLRITSNNGQSVVFIDYFANAANGLNYTFAFDDQSGTIDLTTLGAVSGGVITTGQVYFGTPEGDQMQDGTSGADSYFAGEDDDLIVGNAGPDILSGGLGKDVVVFSGSPVTSVDAAGITVNLATGFGLGGDAQGDVFISIEDIVGSGGRDVLTGSVDANALVGGDGNDTIAGADGRDFLVGDAGDDSISGDAGDDMVVGGSGNDTLRGGFGDDFLAGDTGNDQIFGGDDNGEDIAVGGDGSDTVQLGAGNDTYMIAATETGVIADAGLDTVDGGADSDTIDASNFQASVVITLGGPFDQAQSVASSGANNTTPAGVFTTLANLTGFEHAVGSGFADTVVGNSVANRLFGEGGHDRLIGHGGADTIDGGGGVDTVDYSSEGGGRRVVVDLQAGTAVDTAGNTDTLINIERIVGSNAVSIGLEGDDLYGNAGDNIFVGNKGIDVDLIDGRGGIDTVDYSAEADTQNYIPNTTTPSAGGVGVVVDLSVVGSFSVPNATDTSGHGDLLVSIENVIGSIRADTITGGGEDNLFVGGDGADTLNGGGGFDTLDYGGEVGALGVIVNELSPFLGRDTFGDTDTLSGFERIIGTARADQMIVVGNTERELIGADGDDHLQVIGLSDNNRLFGGEGNDTLIGGEGADYLFGGAGANTATGGGGNDVYLSSGGTDVFNGGTGINEMNFDLMASAVSVDLELGIALTSGTSSAFVGTQRSIVTYTDVDNIRGSRFDDYLDGDAGANRIDAGAGNDSVYGSDGIDTLIGGSGHDTLNYGDGGAGVRIDLRMGAGNATDGFGNVETVTEFERFVTSIFTDTLTGDNGAQTFVLFGGDDVVDGGGGNDIADFGLLEVSGSFSLTFNSTTGIIGGTMTTTAGTVSLTGIEHFIGTSGTFDDMLGGAGNETFTGNAGVDVDLINGGGGIDTVDYSFEAGTQAVTVNL